MKTYAVAKIKVPPFFEKGDCYTCPFGYDEEFESEDDGYETERVCAIGWSGMKCGLEIVKE